ncbi:pheromone-binding protein 2-like isoform X2 [Choristoneura fumiferana]|uniref:pheromone-binding protein 2-like isoform X2 n=1 Tax=Choristoneura fumiferana TaxID=7141 RepID=UPI003D15D963
MVKMGFTKILLSVLFLCREVKPNNQVMKQMSIQIGVAVHHCMIKNGTPRDIVDQIRHFWDDDFNPTPQLGCLLECVFIRLEIFDSDGNLSIPNGVAFLKACGADDNTVKKLAEAMATHCPAAAKGCASALAYAQCFRGHVMMLQMQPESFALHG